MISDFIDSCQVRNDNIKQYKEDPASSAGLQINKHINFVK